MRRIFGYWILFMAVIILQIAPVRANASWLDDWVNQKTSVSPNYFSGQQRGYFTAGSFSARWRPSKTVYPFTAEAPGVDSGCGGIDIFGGALGFINGQQLVQQLQTLLQAAPAVAFNLALNTLCQPCQAIINKIKAIADRLNNIQFNACHDAKVLAVRAVSAVDPVAKKKLAKQVDTKYSVWQGITDMYSTIVGEENGNSTGSSTGTGATPRQINSTKDFLSGCPADVKNLFNSDGQATTTLLYSLGKQFDPANPYDNSTIALMRGLIGDLVFSYENSGIAGSPGAKQLNITYIPPCEQNKGTSIDDFYSGNVYVETGVVPGSTSGSCSKLPVTDGNFIQYMNTKIDAIVNKIKSAQLLGTDVDFVKHMPTPIYSAMKAAILTKQEGAVGSTLADIGARAYAYESLSDLYDRVEHLIEYGQSTISASPSKPHCQVALLDPTLDALKTMRANILKYKGLIEKDYIAHANDTLTLQDLSKNYEMINALANEKINKTFGL